MKFNVPYLFLCLSLVFLGALSADEACKPVKTGKPDAIAGQAAWDLAHDRAMKWEPDARVFEMTTISTGPMDNEGRSTEWYIKFSSEAAKAVDLITISKGNISCWSQGGAGGTVIDFDEKIILDTKRLYDLAQKAGGEKFIATGYKVSATLNQNPSAGALWYFNYENDKYQQGLSVVIDAKTGTVTNVFK